MKYLLMTLAVVMMFAGPALADQGNLSQAQMAKYGLSGMTAMSDAQGTAVRGMGFIVAGSGGVVITRGAVVAVGTGIITNDKVNKIQLSNALSVNVGCASICNYGSLCVTFCGCGGPR
jgi:hypothetical protein